MGPTEAIHPSEQAIDALEFRRVLGHFASGVTVLTSCLAGKPFGTTVSSFCSLSLEPPLVLACLGQHSAIQEALVASGIFAVNILPEDGEWLSRRFASRQPDRFAGVGYREGLDGAPLLDDALATIQCRLEQCYPGGDHTIVVGRVVAAQTRDDTGPLLFYRGGYHQLGF